MAGVARTQTCRREAATRGVIVWSSLLANLGHSRPLSATLGGHHSHPPRAPWAGEGGLQVTNRWRALRSLSLSRPAICVVQCEM